MKLCRKNCIFLYPREENQTSKKEQHICHLFHIQIVHSNNHPHLFTSKNCPIAIDSKRRYHNGNNYTNK